MKLTELKITEFVDLLASDAPAPGGGSAAALTASLGVALTSMVANLTTGKKKYEDHQQLMEEILQKSQKIKADLVQNIDKDTEAFNAVSAVFDMPKETDDEKEKRKMAMQQALKGATIVPFEVMNLCVEALEVTSSAIGKSNTNAASDLGVAALSLLAGIKGAWLNVLINVDAIKDEAFVKEHKEKGEELILKAEELSNKIYSAVLADIS